MIAVDVQFADTQYNYTTSVNGSCTDEEIRRYFVGQDFNLGRVEDNVQRCTGVVIRRDNG